jgi:copper transport protein
VSLRWLLLALLLGTATYLAAARERPAEAHALLVRADPPVNSQLREPPTVLTLYFSEALERSFSSVRVVDQDGNRVDERVEFDDTDEALMRVYVAGVTPSYLNVQWQNVSKVDGHRITGSYPISILNPDGSVAATPPAATSTSAGDSPDALRVVSKAVLLIAGSVLTGGAAFLALVSPAARRPEVRRTFESKAWLALGAAVAVIALAGIADLLLQANEVGAGVSEILDTRWGQRWLVRHAALLLPALAILIAWRRPALGRALAFAALAGSVAFLLATASVSHAAAGGGAFWATLSDFVHLLAASVWIGMLALLILYFRWARAAFSDAERYSVLAATLRRFSIVAVVSVALLLFTGVVNSLVELGGLADLLDTGYGRALLAKLLLLIPLLAVGARNAYLLRPQLVQEAGERQIRSRQILLAETEAGLHTTTRWELGFALAVLAVVALLVQITPARGRIQDAGGAGETYVRTAEGDSLFVTLRVDPNQPGVNTFEVYLAGDTQSVEGLRLEFTRPGGLGSISRLPLEASNPPTFDLGQGAFLTEAGSWTITLNVRRSSGFDLRLDFQDEVQSATPVASGARLGGAYDSPIEFTAAAIGLLAVSLLAAGVLLVGSLPRPGYPDGYLAWAMEEAAYRLPVMRLRPLVSLGVLVAVGIGLGIIVGRHFDQPIPRDEASADNPIEATAESIERGRVLFANNCIQCHGETGRGDGPLAPSLSIPPANLYLHIPFHPDQFFFGVITKGLSGVMPAFESVISEEDRWNILNFLRDQFGDPDPETQ